MPIRQDPSDMNDEQGLIGLGTIPSLAPVAAFNPQQIENLLKTKGINALHYKHSPNPDRKTIEGGVQPNTNSAAKYGWRYYSCRKIRVVPQSFKLENTLNVQGIWGVGSVLMNVAGQYDDGEKDSAYFRPHDIIMLQSDPSGGEITILTEQFSIFNPTGPIKLNFRCEGVELLEDKNRRYIEGQDFSVMDGKIYWLTGGYKPNFINGQGDVLSVVYYARPIYIVQNVPHALRITPGNFEGDGQLPRKAFLAPQLVICKQAWFSADQEEFLDFDGLPSYNNYPDTKNVTGGS